METQSSRSNLLSYTHAAALGIAIAASFASGLITGINRSEKNNVAAVAEAYSRGISFGLKINKPNSVRLEEKSLDGKKWYVLDLEERIKPGDYQLVTEESDGCKILSDNIQIRPGHYKLMFIESIKQSSLVPAEPKSAPIPFNPLRSEEKRNELPYAIPGTNKLDPREAKKFGLPLEGYIVKPHPYKERSFIILKDKDSENKIKLGDYKASIPKVCPDGSIYYSVKVFNKDGKEIYEYIEPSDRRLEKNPAAGKPQFHSTTPVLTYPDGTIEGYRPLKEGENLDDVLKEGPVDRYVPPKESTK